jgi:sulfate adenylyltransferase
MIENSSIHKNGPDSAMATDGNRRLIAPYGDELVDLLVPPVEIDELKAYANNLPSLQLSERSVCDLELLATGAFSPLTRFIGAVDHQRVLDEMRLANGYLFPIPLTLPVASDEPIHLDQDVALRNSKNELLAVMTVDEIYRWDLREVAHKVFCTDDLRHPLISEMHSWGRVNVTGRLRVIQLPRHYDFREMRLTPAQTRAVMEARGWNTVIAFQTRNPLHRAHEEMTKRAVQELDGALLLHPVVGMTKPGDVDHYTRVRTYKALAQRYYDPNRILLALLPLAMRLSGPRGALWHALIRRNYGANHFIIGRDHSSPGVDSHGKPFYGPYDAQKLVEKFQDELGIKVIPFKQMVYLPEEERYEEFCPEISHKLIASISGTQVREDYLNNGTKLPSWFTRPEVAEILAEAYPPRHRQGCCIWFTGLSGAGKSTTAEILTLLLSEHGRQVTVLDGDVVRTHLSKGLGFSREDRDTNIRRISFVASEVVRHGGIAICAAVSPYRATRNDARTMVGHDRFIEVYVNTPLKVCEERDTKGMYSKARQGQILDFTGIDSPYEAPLDAEIEIETLEYSPEENARLILAHLVQTGFVKSDTTFDLTDEPSMAAVSLR